MQLKRQNNCELNACIEIDDCWNSALEAIAAQNQFPFSVPNGCRQYFRFHWSRANNAAVQPTEFNAVF